MVGYALIAVATLVVAGLVADLFRAVSSPTESREDTESEDGGGV